MADGSSSNVRNARPTVAVDGQEHASLAQGLLGMHITETTAGLYRCEMVVGNWGPLDQGGTGFLYFDRKLFDYAKTIKITLGGDTLFEGRISALEGRFPEGDQVEIAILAEDRFQELRMT